MHYKSIFIIYTILLCTKGFAQEEFHADTLTVNETKELLAASRNTTFGYYALADSFSKRGDSVNAGVWLMKVSPYQLMYELQVPNGLVTFLSGGVALTAKAKREYWTLFSKTYNQKRSPAYLQFQQMAEELAASRDQWETCTTSNVFYQVNDELQKKDSLYFSVLHQYITKNGWPTLANGSLYAAQIAAHDARHHQEYIPMLKKEIAKGNVPVNALQEMIYWNRGEELHAYLIKLLKYHKGKFICYEINMLRDNKMPDSALLQNMEYTAHKLSAHYVSTVVFCHDPKLYDSLVKKPLAQWMGEDIDVQDPYALLAKDLIQCMHADESVTFSMRLGLWGWQWMPTDRRGLGERMYMFYNNDTEVAPEANLDKLLTDNKFITHAINFDVAQSTIQPQSMSFINRLATWLKANPSVKLEIDGHTDNDGNEETNLKLSQARANEVKKQLTLLGINEARLTAAGFGATRPIQPNDTPEGKSQNRRVEFVKQ